MKTLLLDIETSPNRVWTWGLFNQNIAINQIDKPGYVLCWAAKWLGRKELIHFNSVYHDSKFVMLDRIHELLSEADAVVHWNGTEFDIPTLNREFLLQGLTPPAPTIEIDLLRTARRKFRLLSNKLAFVGEYLGLGAKIKTDFDLWLGCMAGDAKAWAKMKRYNIQDVRLLEKVYNVLLPWIPNHPNQGLFVDSASILCPRCGSASIAKRGFAYTKTQRYQRYQCNECGSWSRARSTSLSVDRRKKILTDTV